MKYNLLVEWLEEAKILKVGEEILFPVQNAEEQKRFSKELKRELKVLSAIDPVEASKLESHIYFKNSKHWVSLKKTAGTPLVAFKKGTNGSVERVRIHLKGKELRAIKLMKKDRITMARAESLIQRELTEEEKEGWIEKEEK